MRIGENESDARRRARSKASRNRSIAFSDFARSALEVRCVPASLFAPIVALSLIASELQLFRVERRLDGSGELALVILADLAGGAASCRSYHRDMLARVASPDRSEEVTRLPVSEARHSGFVKLACDLWRLVVALMPHCSLRRRQLADVGFPLAAFDMRCNWRPARQNTRWLSRSHNESVPERLLGVRQNKPS